MVSAPIRPLRLHPRGAPLLAATVLAAPLLVAILLATPATALAQVCSAESGAVTTCRLTLSQPRRFTVEAVARFAPLRGSAPADLRIDVDGRSCSDRPGAPAGRRPVLRARCQIALTPASHLVQARATTTSATPAGIDIRLTPDPRLAALPRESQDLLPKPKRPIPHRFGF